MIILRNISGGPIKIETVDVNPAFVTIHSRIFIRNVSQSFLLISSGVGQITSYTLLLRVKSFEEKPPFGIFAKTTVDQVLENKLTILEAIPANFLRFGISSCVFKLKKNIIEADIPFYTYHMGDISACLYFAFVWETVNLDEPQVTINSDNETCGTGEIVSTVDVTCRFSYPLYLTNDFTWSLYLACGTRTLNGTHYVLCIIVYCELYTIIWRSKRRL